MLIPSKIDSVASILQFFKALTETMGEGWHPDNNFEDYINAGTEDFTFDPREANILSLLMDECFEFCAWNEQDVYGLALSTFPSQQQATTSNNKQQPSKIFTHETHIRRRTRTPAF